MKKALKITGFTILLLILVLGVIYLLIYTDKLKAPAFLTDIPVIGSIFTEEKAPKIDTKTIMERENASLQEALDKKNEELAQIQADYKELETQIEILQNNEDKLKEEIINLNEQIIAIKTQQENQRSAYKEMATYYTEMNAKDAAEILSLLEIEHTIGILSEMKSDLVADILQNMPKDKAAQITKNMLVVSP
ncbi:MAG: hypothetical protein GX790_01780 [Syntrophomonadaceae bacterium]|nr:hypothetical protein [Syntrophomonadaceae bacterium]